MTTPHDLKDALKALEVAPDATYAEIKTAYRDLASVWHPDRFSEANPRLREKAETRLKEINRAFEIATDAYRRFGDPVGLTAPKVQMAPDVPAPAAPLRSHGLPWSVFLSLLLVGVGAAAMVFYGQQVERLDNDDEVARKRLKLSESHVQDVMRTVASQPTGTALPTTGTHSPEFPVSPSDENRAGSKRIHSKAPGGAAAVSVDRPRPDRRLAAVDAMIVQAEADLTAGSYTTAAHGYRAALSRLDAASGLPETEIVSRRQVIEQALSSDEMVYGSRGYIRHRGRWIAPDVYRTEFVFFKGERRHYTEMTGSLTRFADPHIRRYLTERYTGTGVHKNQVDCVNLDLLENTASVARFRASYRWEVWTFRARNQGRLTAVVTYGPESERWRIGPIRELREEHQ